MKIQSINQSSFKSLYENRSVYYDLPSDFGKLPQGQIHALNALDRELSGTGIIGSFCPKADLLTPNGWNILTSPSEKVNVIDVAMINNAKIIKKTENNLFGTLRNKNELQYDKAIILGGFYDKYWISRSDLEFLNKFNKIFPMDKLIEKIKEGLAFAKNDILPKQKGIFKLK